VWDNSKLQYASSKLDIGNIHKPGRTLLGLTGSLSSCVIDSFSDDLGPWYGGVTLLGKQAKKFTIIDPIAFAANGSDPDTLHYNAAMKAHDSAEDFKVAMIKEANDHTTRLHWALWEKQNVPAGHKILSVTLTHEQCTSTRPGSTFMGDNKPMESTIGRLSPQWSTGFLSGLLWSYH
jgi:hypothetical protein